MGMTMTQKILAKHAGLDSVTAGQLIEANVHLTLANDITGPVAIREMEKAGFDCSTTPRLRSSWIILHRIRTLNPLSSASSAANFPRSIIL